MSPCSLVPWGHWDAHSPGPICPPCSPGPLSLGVIRMLILLPPWSPWHFTCPMYHPQDKGVACVTPVPAAPHHPMPSIPHHHGALRAHRSPTMTHSTVGTPHPRWGGSVPPHMCLLLWGQQWDRRCPQGSLHGVTTSGSPTTIGWQQDGTSPNSAVTVSPYDTAAPWPWAVGSWAARRGVWGSNPPSLNLSP